MNKYKVCVYAICKNEEKFAERWMKSVGEADVVVVSDTGSTDGTVQKLRALGAEVYVDIIDPWRFDEARNAALGHIPEDVDICVPVDLDEVYEPGWREKLELAWQPDTRRGLHLFTWDHNTDGTPAKQFTKEKVHWRHGYRWAHPVHEMLQYFGEGPEKTIWIEGMVLHHYPDLTKPRSQYLPLLELSAQENPTDDRTVFWLGREYMFNGMHDKAIETLTKHLVLPTARWDEERAASMRFIAKSYQSKSDFAQAMQWFYKSIAECPGVRETYYEAAKLGYVRQDWPTVYFMAERALAIEKPSGSYLVDPDAWGYGLYDLGAISCYQLGLYKKAYEYALKACEISPEDKRLKVNLKLIKDKYDAEISHE